MIRLDYHVFTAAGRLIQTFGCPELVAAWCEQHGPAFPGAEIREVRTRERTLYVLPLQQEAAA